MKEHPGRQAPDSGWVLGASLNTCSRGDPAQAQGGTSFASWRQTGDKRVQMLGRVAARVPVDPGAEPPLDGGGSECPAGRKACASACPLGGKGAAEPRTARHPLLEAPALTLCSFYVTIYAAGDAPRSAPHSPTLPAAAADHFSMSQNSYSSPSCITQV